MLLAIGGEFRKGKSFFLNFCLRYLYHLKNGGRGNDWLDPSLPIQNRFCYKNQSKTLTKGIHIWPEPFFVQNAAGEEVVVFLMDTQGSFDHESTMDDNKIIMGLSTLISSVQVVISYKIQKPIANTWVTFKRVFIKLLKIKKQQIHFYNFWF